MLFSSVWPFLAAGLLCWMTGATLLPRNPGYALSLNGRSNTEYAYSYPRRLFQQFTLEMWLNGYADASDCLSVVSISHPLDANVFSVTDHVTVLGVPVIPHLPLPVARWFHLAVSVDLSAYPAYNVRAYVDSRLVADGAGRFTAGLTPADLEEEVLSIVLGQEQGSVLAGFGNQRIYSGHVDDVRLWDTIRTAEEIEAWHFVTLTGPYPAGLVSYYTFDNAVRNATHYEDDTNTSEQHRLYFADYANSLTAPSPLPAYAPPRTPLPRLALSTAPLCAAGAVGGLLEVRASPAATVAVPVAGLYCNATNSSVRATVTAVYGGKVTTNRTSAMGLPLSSQDTILFTANRSDIGKVEAGSGIHFTITDGVDTIVGFVAIFANSPPILPQRLDLKTDEDLAVAAWVEIIDDDHDIVRLEVMATPARGTAWADGLVDRRLSYAPPLNANGDNLGVFTVQAYDMWGAQSTAMDVSVSVTPVTDPPLMGIVELGPTAEVPVAIQGCRPGTTLLLPLAVLAVVVPLTLGVLAFAWHRRRHKRCNSQALTDPTKDICVLFTDIQSSTLLWAANPQTVGRLSPGITAEGDSWIASRQASVGSGLATPQCVRSFSLLPSAAELQMLPQADEAATVELSMPAPVEWCGWRANRTEAVRPATATSGTLSGAPPS